jgi:hypothetical protein
VGRAGASVSTAIGDSGEQCQHLLPRRETALFDQRHNLVECRFDVVARWSGELVIAQLSETSLDEGVDL